VIEKRLPEISENVGEITIKLSELPDTVGNVIAATYDADGKMYMSVTHQPDAAHSVTITLTRNLSIEEVKLFFLSTDFAPANRMLSTQLW